jgi:hypothetical protein
VRVGIGFERSGIVREAFRALGHDAVSIDLAAAEDGSPYHIRGDFFTVIADMDLDLLICHPECRYLTNSGVLRLYLGGKKRNGRDKQRWGLMELAARQFRRIWDLPIKKLCIENPVMHGHAARIIGVRHTQTIQPWMFGEDASKRTCLWLRGLPPLVPTDVLKKARYANQTPSGQNKLGPSPERAMNRARTYPGIARAFTQWAVPQ